MRKERPWIHQRKRKVMHLNTGRNVRKRDVNPTLSVRETRKLVYNCKRTFRMCIKARMETRTVTSCGTDRRMDGTVPPCIRAN